MALVVADRVKETTTSTGTGAITLGGAEPNFRTFSSVLSDADTTYYAIIDDNNLAFEVGLGTYASSGNTITRTTVLASSNSNNAVNFSAGTKDVFINYPAGKSAYLDGSGQLVIGGTAVTSTAAELNILDGVTATAAELNILDGVTSTTAELNLVDGSTANTVVNSKAVIYGSSGEITSTQLDVTGQGDLRLQDSSGGQYVALQAASTVGSSYTLTLPSADGSSGQFIKTDGSGALSFGDAGGGLTSSAFVDLVVDATEVEFTGIPSGVTMIFIQMKELWGNDDGNDWGVQLGGSSGYKTSGYTSSTWDGPGDSTGSQSGKLGLFYYNSTGRIDAASAILWKGPSNNWMSMSSASTHFGVAYVDLGQEVTKLKLMLQNGGRDFRDGTVAIQYM